MSGAQGYSESSMCDPSSWAFWPGLRSHLGNLESERRAHKLLWLGCCHYAGTSLHLQSFFFLVVVVVAGRGDEKHVSFLWTDVGLTVERSAGTPCLHSSVGLPTS